MGQYHRIDLSGGSLFFLRNVKTENTQTRTSLKHSKMFWKKQSFSLLKIFKHETLVFFLNVTQQKIGQILKVKRNFEVEISSELNTWNVF